MCLFVWWSSATHAHPVVLVSQFTFVQQLHSTVWGSWLPEVFSVWVETFRGSCLCTCGHQQTFQRGSQGTHSTPERRLRSGSWLFLLQHSEGHDFRSTSTVLGIALVQRLQIQQPQELLYLLFGSGSFDRFHAHIADSAHRLHLSVVR